MKPLFDKTEFKKQMSKIFTMETESEKKTYQTQLRIQAEKEMIIIKTELLQGGSTSSVIPQHGALKCVESTESNTIMREFQEYLNQKQSPTNTP